MRNMPQEMIEMWTAFMAGEARARKEQADMQRSRSSTRYV